MLTDNARESESTNSQDERHQAFTRHRNPIHDMEGSRDQMRAPQQQFVGSQASPSQESRDWGEKLHKTEGQ